MSDRGLLIVISGPSGAGKGTICANIRKEMPNLVYSVSMTTRAPRVGEEEGLTISSAPRRNLRLYSVKMHSWSMQRYMIITMVRLNNM